MKYIRFTRDHMPVFVAFPENVEHKVIADALKPTFGAPVSAGFVSAMNTCYGASHSLKLSAKEDDSRKYRCVMATMIEGKLA